MILFSRLATVGLSALMVVTVLSDRCLAAAAIPANAQIGTTTVSRPSPSIRAVWRVSVNASDPVRRFSTVVGFDPSNAGDLFGTWPDQAFYSLKKLGITSIRTHDAAEMDWPQLFPNWSANPDSPSSYDFKNSDRILKAMVQIGFAPFLSLGTSGYDPNGLRYEGIADNPPNPLKWSRIAEHIVAHDVGGWDHGYHFPIKYVEIWNEPTRDRRGFWSGTPQQFYALCADTLRTIKGAFPKLWVGACGVCFPNRPTFTSDLLAYLASHHTPLNFFSWHVYEGNPVYLGKKGDGVSMFLKFARLIRRDLNRSGYTKCQSICSEWNAPTPFAVLNTLMLAQHERLAATYLYPGLWHPRRYWISGLDQTWVRPDQNQIWRTKEKAWAFRAYWVLRSITPLWIPVKGEILPHSLAIAARTHGTRCLQLLLSDTSPQYRRVRVILAGCPARRRFRVVRIPLDDLLPKTPVDSGNVLVPRNGKLKFWLNWSPPEAMILRITVARQRRHAAVLQPAGSEHLPYASKSGDRIFALPRTVSE